ncbi:HIT family protein [Infirmifilum lucidum]|uniref:HIT family protein n=1 Tax=Infirmifilum lucidum TaxID=2776706 RepID=A0A7L9FK59_9CREN|nr:HIT family protein [Infirmifilum lucidum]QOJ79393.1 HIT family protein [Infirmifilum lucidum]
MSGECVFCRIALREQESFIVYEDEEFMVFLDKYPITLGHALVAPKRHYVNIFDMPEESVARAFVLARKVAEAQLKALGATGVRIVMNNGRDAGQEIMHAHIHVVPYGVPRLGRRELDRREGEKVAAVLRGSLA